MSTWTLAHQPNLKPAEKYEYCEKIHYGSYVCFLSLLSSQLSYKGEKIYTCILSRTSSQTYDP